MTKILTVANHIGSKGGLERSQLEICRQLHARGHEVHLAYVHDGDFLPDWRAAGTTTIRIPTTLPSRRGLLRSLAGVARGLASCWSVRPDVIYVHRYWDVPWALALGTLTSRPVVCHLHLAPGDSVPRWLMAPMSRVSRFIAVSNDTAERWGRFGLDRRRIDVAHNGVDVDRFRPATADDRELARKQLGIDPDTFVVLYVGRVDPSKGIEVLLDAFVELDTESVQLVIVGGPGVSDDPDVARSLVDRAEGLGAKCIPPRRDVEHLYHCADVVVLPSLVAEAHSLVVMEALASGIPVVASAVGGNTELLTGSLSEGLVEPGEPVLLAERLSSLRDWRTSRPDLEVQGRERVASDLTWSRTAEKVERSLAAAMRRTRGSSRRSR
ncbi:MAG: glycosyltransferase family 4 protein [Actinomycetota bacterium]|jgi:glycosyltransferase involved in cell wall biosynthesis|nr:glycosyltransferase family 4 protein [Actinomycetota bacterium]